MRKISIILGLAALILLAIVGFTYRNYWERQRRHLAAVPDIPSALEAVAKSGWKYQKDDPITNKPVVLITAEAFEAAHDPSSVALRGVTLRLFNKEGTSYTFVRSQSALFDERSGTLKSRGDVSIVMRVPVDKNAEKPADIVTLVQVSTSGIVYDTKTGRAETDEKATFHFKQGGGMATGVSYDPTTRDLHMKSQVSLDLVHGADPQNAMHVETGDLSYKELEHKIYLSPWSKMTRGGTITQALASVVTIDENGELQQIDSEQASGVDTREDKQTEYSADHITALFNDEGVMTELRGVGHARVLSAQDASRTLLTGDRATLQFAVTVKAPDAPPESDLRAVVASGHAVAQSDPIARPGIPMADTRILRSETINLAMTPDGRNVSGIQTPGPAELEFKPNRAGEAHRIVNASSLQVTYGGDSYIETLVAENATTRTDKPANEKAAEASPAFTWSDHMSAHFLPGSNQISTLVQSGHFRYAEGLRTASAASASLDQQSNRMTLTDNARVADNTGSAIADRIVMDQTSGDMDAVGHVVSTHAPDPHQKPGTSMLDNTKTMQAKAGKMTTRESNARIVYEDHALVWQGANRISADRIDIDRNTETLHASGSVESDLVDNNASSDAPIFTIVKAPDLRYRDDTRLAIYTGGVKLTHDRLTVTSQQLKAFLTPKTESGGSDSSLEKAYADGDANVSEILVNGDLRKGTAEHCDYYTKDSKVVLHGGRPEMVDARKGITRGEQLTYFSDDDRLIVQGEKSQLAYTRMKKH